MPHTYPVLAGYTLDAGHDCPRCGGPVLARYLDVQGAARSPYPFGAAKSWDWYHHLFTGGLFGEQSVHYATGYDIAQRAACGWTLPPKPDGRVSWIDGLYRAAGGGWTAHVARFDPARLLAAPWLLWTVPDRAGEPPVALLPSVPLLRLLLSGYPAPPPGTAAVAVSDGEAARVPALLLEAVGGVIG
jgi:hypothetical protein